MAPVQDKILKSSIPIDNPQKENYWVGGFSTFIIGSIMLLAHTWFLFYMQDDYNNNYKEYPLLNHIKDYVSYWVPIFLITIALEALYFRIKAPDSNEYRVNDSLGSLVLGSFSRISKVFLEQFILIQAPYCWIYENYGQNIVQLFPILQNHMFAWWFMFFAVEFSYYWVHRTGHTINAFWAMHGVHHSSESYNLTTALRQSSLHMLVSWAYYCPFAFFFPPPLFLIHSQFNLLYQYWIHTQIIGKLGPLEYILNTPSQHRVHHGRNSYCIDKNYGGTLCIFDRLFGTFQEEIEDIPVVYGMTHSLDTFEPIKGNFIPWKNIWNSSTTVSSIKDKLLCLYNGPGWIPGSHPYKEYSIPPCTRVSVQKYDTTLSFFMKIYLLFQFLFATLGFQLVVFGSKTDDYYWISMLGLVYIAYSFYCIGVSCDLNGNWAVFCQILHGIIAVSFYFWFLFYVKESYTQLDIIISCILCILNTYFIINQRKGLGNKTLITFGKDFEYTAESEKQQYIFAGKEYKQKEQ